MVTEEKILAKDIYHLNATDLVKEIDWFTKVVQARISINNNEEELQNIYEIKPPVYDQPESVFAEFVEFYQLSFSERIVLTLALLPHIAPQVLDIFFSTDQRAERTHTEYGGVKANTHNGFLPTVETAMFILAGNDLAKRFRLQQLFDAEHLFNQHKIISLSLPPANEPFFAAQLLLNEEYVDLFTNGKVRRPIFSMNFPAKLITTSLNWNDLVLDAHTLQQLNEIKIWLQYGSRLMNEWEMKKRLKPGYKALFYGPPGTGKTLTAALLGKYANLDVYRVDLSMVVSKYIGETEKNLEKIFSKAEHKNWILFFDEADALFGKRTSISDAHDKYANQEIAYLLQRLEDYNGLVILSSNMRTNVDEAFSRRLQSVIYFPMPKPEERLQLWKQSFSTHCTLAEHVKLEQIAEKFLLAGGSIINAVQYASLMALHRNENVIQEQDILEGIKKEYTKEGKTL